MVVRAGAATAAALAALVAAACSSEVAAPPDPDATPSPTATATDAPSASPSETASPTDQSTSPPAVVGMAGRTLGEPVELGAGTVIRVAPDGEHVLVSATIPFDDSLGCEGVPFEVPWVLDLETSQRELAIDVPADEQPFVTDVLVAPDGSTAALVGACEGFLGSVTIASIEPDGRLRDLQELTLPPIELRPWSLHWMPDGASLVGTGAAEFDQPGVYVIDVPSGEWTDIDQTGFLDWVPLSQGRALELLDGRAVVRSDAGRELTSFPADTVTPSAEGLPLVGVVYGEGADDPGSISLVSDTLVREVLTRDGGYAPVFSPDASMVSWSSYDPATDRSVATLHDLATGRQVLIDDVYFAGVHFPRAGVVYVARGPEDEYGYPGPALRLRPWVG